MVLICRPRSGKSKRINLCALRISAVTGKISINLSGAFRRVGALKNLPVESDFSAMRWPAV